MYFLLDKHTSGIYHSLRTYPDMPDMLFIFNENDMFGIDGIKDDYIPELYYRIDSAEMYDLTGELNGYLRSLLFIEQGYYEEVVCIDNYICDTFDRRIELVSRAGRRVEFKAEFTDEATNETVFIRFVKMRSGDEWITTEWEILN